LFKTGNDNNNDRIKHPKIQFFYCKIKNLHGWHPAIDCSSLTYRWIFKWIFCCILQLASCHICLSFILWQFALHNLVWSFIVCQFIKNNVSIYMDIQRQNCENLTIILCWLELFCVDGIIFCSLELLLLLKTNQRQIHRYTKKFVKIDNQIQ